MNETGRVLVVDDMEAHRYIVSSWLRRAGYEVLEAATGAEALDRVAPDLHAVVLDVNLPDMSGFDVCKKIKQAAFTGAVPVVHLSSTAVDPSSRARGLDSGADAYLVEPVDPQEFLATVRAVGRSGTARRTADRLVEQLTQLAAATLPVNAADSLGRLLEAVACGAAAVFDQPGFAAGALAEGRAMRCLCPPGGAAPVFDPSGPPLTPIWRPGSNVVLARDVPEVWAPLLERAGVQARDWCAIPIYDNRGVAGGVAVALPEHIDDLTPDQFSLLERLAEAMRVALDNLRAFTEEHRIALTLQRALLPRELPLVPGLSFEGRYSSAGESTSVGGDFYDAFEVPTGEVAAVIGDVQGHSLHAGTLMAELRFSLRAYLGQPHDAVTALELLDVLMQRNHPDETASVALLVFDHDRRRAVVANAGHLPPLLVTADEARYLEGGGTLLGVGGVPLLGLDVALPAPCAVLLVTDGLIERRGESITESLETLRVAALRARTLDPALLADALLEAFADTVPDDDIAVLVVRVDPPET